jgi:hypothetical protein
MHLFSWAVACASAILFAACASVPSRYDASNAEPAGARPVLWIDQGDIGQRDLYWGAGSPDGAPQPPFTFEEEDTGGTSPKLHVTDARGTRWTMKFSGGTNNNEVHAEIAAGRLSWALGYLVEETYFVPEGRIDGVGRLGRARESVEPDGRFRLARFEKRADKGTELDASWTLDENPFADSKELSGLKLLSGLLHNWDARPQNLGVILVRPEGRTPEHRFVVTDLGATFGHMARGLLERRSKWNLEHYRAQNFLAGADEKIVRLNYRSVFPFDPKIPTEHARWFADLVSRLREDQVRRAFDASGAGPEEAAGFTAAFLEKVAQLRDAVG